ncbi:hypothetical protein BDV25DRAFT_152170 [Aspergillus avenaceus]|uniref:Xylanolytic transcriptional activator regulatory domain-containing protein n=1 Tax=Aspergillus avenaceus TaxID=36643 RepID=A0A5N6TZI5_ASPAV|nr:hypothetical protein BDV25DRAFT_152170 [Aspergillus avenaceus]
MYLQLAILATSMQYSSDQSWGDSKAQVIDTYARWSWAPITTYELALQDEPNLAVVQAIALLAVIDAVAGRKRASWVKIGMAIRIGQDLRLMCEPDPALPVSEQLDRRRLFWSLYLEERIVCCASLRPLAIRDSECYVRLPSAHEGYSQESPNDQPVTLPAVLNDRHPKPPGDFSSVILMASAMGRTAQYAFHDMNETLPPWNPKSEYGSIQSTLFIFTSQSEPQSSITETIRRKFQVDGKIDQPKAGHFILSHALYHLSYCILTHPFLLAMKLRNCGYEIPPTWLKSTRDECFLHSQSLSRFLIEAKAVGCMTTATSSYCILVAGSIQALFLDAEDSQTQDQVWDCIQSCREYLEDVSHRWKSAHSFAAGLDNFLSLSVRYSPIVKDHTFVNDLSPADIEILRSVIDFGIMSNPSNPVSKTFAASDMVFNDESYSMLDNIEGLSCLPQVLSSAQWT